MAGETTALTAAQAAALRLIGDNPGAGLFAVILPKLTFGTGQNELADVMQAGYLPPYAKPLAVLWAPTDMDTNVSPAVVHKVSVGSTDIVTGLTGAQTGISQLVPVTPAAIVVAPASSAQLVTVTSTTAAATAAAGTATLVIICQRVAG